MHKKTAEPFIYRCGSAARLPIDGMVFVLFRDILYIVIVDVSFYNRIKKGIFSNGILRIDNEIIPVTGFIPVGQVNR